VSALIESMAQQHLEDGDSGESGGVDGFRQRRLSGESFMPAGAVGGSHVELLATRWKSISDRWTPLAAAGSMAGRPHGRLFPKHKINSVFKIHHGKNI
jgi:hypothetical protein